MTQHFGWSAQSEKAAALLADDEQSDEAIAAAVGVKRATVARWKRNAAFAARITELVAAAREAARKATIAAKERRVDTLVERHTQLYAVIAARAEEHKAVPGGATGFLVREPKIVKLYEVRKRKGPFSLANDDGDDEELIPTGRVTILHEYRVDTGLLNELRQIEKQLAQELGEWTEKKEVTGKGGGPLIKAYIGFDLDDV